MCNFNRTREGPVEEEIEEALRLARQILDFAFLLLDIEKLMGGVFGCGGVAASRFNEPAVVPLPARISSCSGSYNPIFPSQVPSN